MPQDWLGSLGLQTPTAPAPTDLQIKNHYDRVAEENANYRKKHPIRQKFYDIAGAGLDYLGGLTGLEDKPENTANMLGQLTESATDLVPQKAALKVGAKTLLAGFPFAHYAAKGTKLVHGTPEPWNYVDPAKLKESTHGMEFFGSPDTDMTGEFAERFGNPNPGDRPTSIPFTPDAKNVLDLVETDPVDIQKVIRGMEPEVAERYMDYFNHLVNEKRMPSYEAYEKLAEIMGVPSGVATKAGFDAVRYPYGSKVGGASGEKSEAWGFPQTTPIRSTLGGAPLNAAAGPKQTYVPKAKPKVEVKAKVEEAPKPKLVKPEEKAASSSKRLSIAELMAQTEKERPKSKREYEASKKLDVRALLNK